MGLLLGMIAWLGNSGNPPTGKTSAPFDGNCNDCHNGGNFNGNIDVTGFPAVANPGQIYDINVKMTATFGNPVEAGLQMVVVDANNGDCGDLSESAAELGTEMLSGREYIEHRGPKTFVGGMVSWDFKWEAPMSVPGNTVKVYYIVNLCNNNNGSGGDAPVWENLSFSFSGPPPVEATISNTVNPSCNGGNNGSATVEATGGNTPYTYAWTGGQTTQTAINLVAGTYTVTVTGAGGSGSATAVATLTQPSAVTLATSVSGMVTCITSATATAIASGGTPGYTYAWSDGQTSDVAIFDVIGTYAVTTTDANGCTKAATVNITGDVVPPVAVVAPGGEITCLMPQIQLNGSGSSTGAAFTYLWTTQDGNIVSGANSLMPTINNCGTYVLTVTNTNNGCTASASTQVICNNQAPNASATGGAITCASPSLVLQGNSTTPGVSFAWTGPGITPANQNEQNPSVNLPGLYTLTVTNPVNGCTKSASATVTSDFTPPTAIGSVSGNLTCVVTSVSLNLTTNAAMPGFEWTGPNGFSSNIANPSISVPGDYYGTVTNLANGCETTDTVSVQQNIVPPGASASAVGQINCINNLVQLIGNSPLAPNVTFAWSGQNFNSNLQNPVTDAPGTYTLTVTGNDNGCTSTAIATVIQNIVAPFDSIVPPAHLNCNNPSIQLNGTPSSQGPNFDYLWTTKNGGHIVSGDTSLTPTVDSVGRYFLQVTNIDNGCTALDSVEVILSPAVTASIAGFTNVSCNGGSNGTATAAGAGGNGIFTYAWSTGDTSATISGLAAGTYFSTVTDGENCSASVSVTIAQPDLLLANATATGETALGANDGTATANPAGGTPGYTYLWSNNGTTQTISNLTPGSYSVVVTDGNGCTALQTVTVNAFGCNLSGTISSTNGSCNGSNDGLASVTLIGASNPVTYLWSNNATTQSINNLSPGLYTVSVVDGNNCPAVFSTNVSEPPALSPNASATGVTSNGANDGTATAAPTGGTPGYQYLWSTNDTTQGISGLAPGTYTVVVTDANGCSNAQTVNVAAFNCALAATISGANALCFGNSDGQATIAVTGGALPYSYLWSNSATTQTVLGLSAGTYTATATDAAGCSTTQTVTINQPDLLVATVTSVQNVLCPQDLTGSATIAISGGTAPYTFSWPAGNTNNLGVGTYTISITDANGCTTITSFSIVATDNEGPTMTCPSEIQICGANLISYGTPSVTDNCGIAIPPTVISGPPSGSVFNDGTTVIVYQATDVSGNTATCSFNITVNPVPDILIDNTTNDVNGQGLGAISVTPVGNAPFTYSWNKNGQAFANTEDLTGLFAGVYALVITDANGCTSGLAPITITNTVGIYEPNSKGSVKLWPNPASTDIQLEIIDLDIIAASIVDLRGALIQAIPVSVLRDAISIRELPEGVYCLLLTTNNGQLMGLKFVKTAQ